MGVSIRKSAVPALAIVGAMALFSAGSAYAATLITGKDVKDGSLTGKDIKDGSVGLADLGSSARLPGPAGPQGEQGPSGQQGPQGPAGTAPVGAIVPSYKGQITINMTASAQNSCLAGSSGQLSQDPYAKDLRRAVIIVTPVSITDYSSLSRTTATALPTSIRGFDVTLCFGNGTKYPGNYTFNYMAFQVS